MEKRIVGWPIQAFFWLEWVEPWGRLAGDEAYDLSTKEAPFGCCAFVLYQGTTSVGPYRIERELGFSPCYGASCTKCLSGDKKEKAQGLLNRLRKNSFL
jgi:hypothetical protein